MTRDELLERLATMPPEQRIAIDSAFLVSAAELSRVLASEGVGEREDRDWAFSGGWTDGGPLNDPDCKHCVAECTCRIAIPPNEQEAR